ncbi:MAG: efflux RND transporter periplasmic adaptor subunit [Acidobacteria bacterium]|nr:efflux RND transporter periplasmic adaptor subunit [Acidobacteriota bacterium]
MLNQLKNKWALAVLIASAVTGLLMVACGPHGPRGPRRGTPEVSVVIIKAERVVLTTELPGRTAPFRIAEIRPQVNGLILKRLFTEGTDVKKGQVLYQIDPAPYQAAFNQAKAAVAMAEANIPALRSREERFKGLVTIHAVGQQDYDDALAALNQMEAQLQASKAAMESARINLSYTPIKAPISGRIGRSNVTEGALVTAYQPVPLATIQQLDPIYMDVPQSTSELLKLKKRLADGQLDHDSKDGNKVKIILDDESLYSQEGTLQFQDVSVDPSTGSVILRVVVPNPKKILLPGMFVRTLIKEGVKENAILVPQQGVSRDPKGNPFSLIVDKTGKVSVRPLTLDRAIRDKWLVTSGLAPGDRVIVEGIQSVRPGMTVKATPFHKTAAGHGKTSQADRPQTESN